jgi:phosphatidylethanolamine/phosphatidyl-N-methylethanolamine N-methyltransferase
MMKSEAVLATYRRYAGVYDRVFGKVFDAGRRAAVAAVNAMPGSQRVLEVGVGTGLSLPLYRADHRVAGIDLSEPMLRVAQRRANGSLPQVDGLACMDALSLGFPDACVDVVVAMYVVSVVPDATAAVREMVRVCRPGGRILVVNHFTGRETGIAAGLQKALDPLAETLGWRPYFPLSRAFAGVADLTVERVTRLPPIGLFSIVESRRHG